MSKVDSSFSENEDDPDIYESSGDEWNTETERKRNNRRASQRLSKKPRITHVESSSDSEIEETKPKPKNGVSKRQKIATSTKVSPNSPKKCSSIAVKVLSGDFGNGGFLISKKDAQTGDPNKHPCIWKIDGKALLQKYEPFEEDGKIRHRNTSIYTGWSPLEKDLYAPVTISIVDHAGPNTVVELNWQKLKEITMDSD